MPLRAIATNGFDSLLLFHPILPLYVFSNSRCLFSKSLSINSQFLFLSPPENFIIFPPFPELKLSIVSNDTFKFNTSTNQRNIFQYHFFLFFCPPYMFAIIEFFKELNRHFNRHCRWILLIFFLLFPWNLGENRFLRFEINFKNLHPHNAHGTGSWNEV